MRGAISPLPQYAFMAWCSVKSQGKLYLLPLPCMFTVLIIKFWDFFTLLLLWQLLMYCESVGLLLLLLLLLLLSELDIFIEK